MQWQLTSYVIVLLVSAGISAGMAGFVWHWRTARGGLPLVLFLVAVVEWTLATAFEAAAVGIPGKVFWAKVSYAGVMSAPVFFLVFALAYTHRDRWLTWRNLVLLSLIPVITFALAITNEWHNLIWTSFTLTGDGRNALVYGHGAWFWVMVVYVYLLVTTGILLLARAAFKYRHIYRRQTALLLLSGIFPWLGNVLYVSGWGPFPGQDLTPVGFGITGLLLTLNMYLFHFLDFVPVARDLLVEKMHDGVLVLDGKNRIVDVNPAANRLVGVDASCIGADVGTALAAWPELAAACLAATEARSEIRLNGEPSRYLGVQVSDLRDRHQADTGRLVVLRDITERRRSEEEREQLVLELQDALVKVKTLRGLLPICANCKKIRDDEGYWHSVEEYVRDHSEVKFSHGICPDCAKELYPWYRPDEE